MDRVKNKIAVVTGGAAGIGRSACELLAREGAKVAVTDIDEVLGLQVTKQIQAAGYCAEFWQLDVRNESEVNQVFKQIVEKFGRIDVLVNNAGISGVNKAPHEVTESEWDQVYSANVKGVFFCTKYVIPYMREAGGGSIINMASAYGIVGAVNNPPYHASKGTIRSMTKVDALWYAPDKIRINSIHPGAILTPLLEKLAQDFEGGREHFIQVSSDLHPLGHIGEPDDIGYGVVYLASDESKFMTGSELIIDGGYTAR